MSLRLHGQPPQDHRTTLQESSSMSELALCFHLRTWPSIKCWIIWIIISLSYFLWKTKVTYTHLAAYKQWQLLHSVSTGGTSRLAEGSLFSLMALPTTLSQPGRWTRHFLRLRKGTNNLLEGILHNLALSTVHFRIYCTSCGVSAQRLLFINEQTWRGRSDWNRISHFSRIRCYHGQLANPRP